MRKHLLFFLNPLQCIFIGGLLLFSCSTNFNDFYESQNNNEEYIEFTFTTNNSRANVDFDGSGFFKNGDVIGLYINDGHETEFRKLTYINGGWTPRLRRSDFGEGELTFSAHYPLLSETEFVSSYHIQTNQNTEGYNPADILFAQSTLPIGEYKSNMVFNHKMHRLIINLNDELKKAEVKVRTIVDGEINLLTGEATVSSTNATFDFITPKKNNDGCLEAIIYPQPTAPYKNNDGLIEISLDGKKSIYKVPEKGNDGELLTVFEEGKTFTVNLKMVTPDFDWANKKVWVYGINPPKDGAWSLLYPTIKVTEYLLWKKEYGWYDINKRNPSNISGGIPDGMMCWAAAGSNLLHWWIDQNKEYIDKYVTQNKYKGPDYQYNAVNAVTDNKQESAIFQSFLNSFQNEAGNIDEGINWFIHGYLPVSNTMRDPINYAGYFKDVFPKNVKLAKGIGGMGKETFNKTIKDALLNKKGIGMNRGYILGSHAMVIWGAEFDENGDVSYIYLADNNDRNQFQFQGYGCERRKIVYFPISEGGLMTGYTKGELNEPENSYIPINRLYTLELGTNFWKEYFNKPENNR